MGLRDETFNGIAPEKITNGLNEIFAPEIHWEMNVHEFKGKMFGLIYTHESVNKPIRLRPNTSDTMVMVIAIRATICQVPKSPLRTRPGLLAPMFCPTKALRAIPKIMAGVEAKASIRPATV